MGQNPLPRDISACNPLLYHHTPLYLLSTCFHLPYSFVECLVAYETFFAINSTTRVHYSDSCPILHVFEASNEHLYFLYASSFHPPVASPLSIYHTLHLLSPLLSCCFRLLIHLNGASIELLYTLHLLFSSRFTLLLLFPAEYFLRLTVRQPLLPSFCLLMRR